MLMEYDIKTHKREELIDITEHILQSIRKSNIKEGIVIVFTPHTTAALTINENADPSVKEDILEFLNRKISKECNIFTHLEGNSDAHIKSSLFGTSLSLIVSRGQLLLGTWQGIYFCEFDGPRSRRFYVKIIRDNL
ncbi:secondary thiamine-phosphate synthase enzyme YjbQ [Methanothermococcus sp. SCGC AD-155-C09]|nr:secondary thiamine-phosphate synthase enzyme YjbQ [Methanothermococcus sp. SCGC AD-155-C09]